MKAILKEVGKPPKVIDIENTLEALQKVVGGYIEAVNVGGNTVMLCDEEGNLKGKPYNFDLGNSKIVGDVLFLNQSNEDFTGVDEATEKMVMNFFARTPYTT